MNQFKISKDFDYDVYNVIKIIKIINKKSYIKITILIIKYISIFKTNFLSIISKKNIYISYRLLMKQLNKR